MSKQKEKVKAKERIAEYFGRAEKLAKSNEQLSTKYVKKAKGLAMHFNIKMPRGLRKKFCRKCFSYLTPGSSRIRIKRGFVVIKCLNCDTISRYKAV